MSNSSSLNGKEPWLAVLLSNIFPGLGQIYARQAVKGAIFIGASLLLLVLIGWTILSPNGSIWLGLQLLIVFLILAITSLVDAHRSARKGNDQSFEQSRQGDKDPWLAVFLSKIIPGLGHAYQGQLGYGILFFLLVFGSNFIAGIFPVLLLPATILFYFCLYHVYQSSPTRRVKSRSLIIIICLVLLVTDIFFSSVKAVEARYIPSGAMEPTLQINDRILVNKLSYWLDEPKRGDVVTFLSPGSMTRPQQQDVVFIQRIIGLPGDVVEVKNGAVLINNQPLEERYIKESADYEWGPESIPEDAYFVLGDNRNNSYDSHAWGFVDRDNILGKATKIWWPVNRSGVIE